MPKPVSEFQPALLDLSPIVEVRHDRRATIQERFEAFHRANPGVFHALSALALDMQRRGVSRYGMKGLFEVLRWEYALQTQGSDYKLDNNFHSRYARLLMEREPQLAGFFETRCLLAE